MKQIQTKRLARWLPVAVLALVTVAASAVAIDLSNGRVPALGDPIAAEGSNTAVLSARRVPLVTSAPLAGRRLDAALAEFIDDQDATTCLEVRIDDDILFAHRATDPIIPASTQKLLTAAGAALTLGVDHTFETIAAATSSAGGVVNGDLFLIGGGDPLLATDAYVGSFRRQPQIHSDFEALAQQIAEAGVTQITGGVVGDERRYDTQRGLPIPEVWLPEDLEDDVTGPLSALYVNDGFTAFPGDGDGTTEFVESADPAGHAAQLLTDQLRLRGITVAAEGRSGATPDGVERVATLASLPVREILAEMLQTSDNSTAELLLKEIGRVAGDGPTSAAGAAALETILTDAGFSTEATRVLDGSGVANGNLTTCRLMAEILADDRVDEVIVEGLAVAGESGTLVNRYRDTPLAGNLRAKTGSLRIVSALSGQVTAQKGDRIQFAYVVNVDSGSVLGRELVESQEQLGLLLLAHPDVPDIEDLGPR